MRLVVFVVLFVFASVSGLYTPHVKYLFENTGNIGQDSIAGRDAANVGSPAIVVDPERGNVLSLDGVAYLRLPTSVPEQVPMTMSLWVKPESGHTYMPVFDSDKCGHHGIGIEIEYPGRAGFSYDSHNAFVSTATVDYDQWQHVAAVFDTNQISFYKNGVLTKAQAHSWSTLDGQQFTIGYHCADSQHRYHGLVDDARIYYSALSASDIQGVYNEATPAPTHRFQLYTTLRTWADAKAQCESLGRTLANFKNADENNFAFGLLQGASAWIGLNDIGQENKFVWTDCDTVTFSAWNPGEPNDSNGEDCAELLTNAKWNDLPCTHTRQYLCGPVRTGCVGDPIYRSFDGLGFEYNGVCPLTLVESEKFSVTAYNTPCGLKSCLEKAKVTCGADVVWLSNGPDVMVNGREMKLDDLLDHEVRTGGVVVHADIADRKIGGTSIVVRLSCEGLHIRWSGKHWGNIRFELDDGVAVSGLLGNKDGNRLNDLRKRDGTVVPLKASDLDHRGRVRNSSVVSDWIWSWVESDKSREACRDRSVSVRDSDKKHTHRLCRRMLSMLPSSRGGLCGDMEHNVFKCAEMVHRCFGYPKRMLKCAEWAVREIVDDCDVARGKRGDPNTESGFIF